MLVVLDLLLPSKARLRDTFFESTQIFGSSTEVNVVDSLFDLVTSESGPQTDFSEGKILFFLIFPFIVY